MTTSLARQLKKLAVPQTTILLEDKVKASLLFDPREASSYDRDTIFAIGLTGLEELELIEPEFAIFEQSLFNESAKTFERAVKTQEVNLQLDNAIKKFLVLVSPYFLLRPAHKALEWLIHRFHIHVYNVDDLIACILPYHETRIFVRVIQLLNLNDATSRWHWLKPLQV
ncbi:HEAT repeat-containing protein 1-like [Tachypleus tridentatus]|uniref:HEAT repeat-containing protein 1-like n=1 Tax=Tachypleus tridentatus TaxID=6853 RepID=UPI003FD01CA1